MNYELIDESTYYRKGTMGIMEIMGIKGTGESRLVKSHPIPANLDEITYPHDQSDSPAKKEPAQRQRSTEA